MFSLIRTTCFMFVLGMVSAWPYPFLIERRLPITYVQTTMEEGSGGSPSSIFNEMDRMMANMHERFKHMFNWPTFPAEFNDLDYDFHDGPQDFVLDDLYPSSGPGGVIDIEKELDAVQPVCTTTTDTPTTISPRKSRRKKLPATKTIRCVKELVVNGQKHFSEEITTVDDKGEVLKHSKSSGAVSVDDKPTEQ